jgi:hypothetical protein
MIAIGDLAFGPLNQFPYYRCPPKKAVAATVVLEKDATSSSPQYPTRGVVSKQPADVGTRMCTGMCT